MNFHGGNIYGFEDILDYSSNINPLGVPNSFKTALSENADDFSKYPEIKYNLLKKNISEYLKTDKENIVLGNGAVEIIYNFFRICNFKKVYILYPTFSEYKKAASLLGIAVEELFIYDFSNMNFNIDNILEKIEKNTVVVICNPNNPTGSILRKNKLIWFSQELFKKNSFLFLDETFMEFTGSMSDSLLNSGFKNVFVLMAATKFFGIPGVRLGYGICERKFVERIEEVMPPWNINTAAVIAGQVIFCDLEYISKTHEWLYEIKNMYMLLEEIEYIKVFKSYANFHMIKILKKNTDCIKLYRDMIQKGFLIRMSEGFLGLDSSFFRIAVKDKNNNKKIVEALKEVLN